MIWKCSISDGPSKNLVRITCKESRSAAERAAISRAKISYGCGINCFLLRGLVFARESIAKVCRVRTYLFQCHVLHNVKVEQNSELLFIYCINVEISEILLPAVLLLSTAESIKLKMHGL